MTAARRTSHQPCRRSPSYQPLQPRPPARATGRAGSGAGAPPGPVSVSAGGLAGGAHVRQAARGRRRAVARTRRRRAVARTRFWYVCRRAPRRGLDRGTVMVTPLIRAAGCIGHTSSLRHQSGHRVSRPAPNPRAVRWRPAGPRCIGSTRNAHDLPRATATPATRTRATAQAVGAPGVGVPRPRPPPAAPPARRPPARARRAPAGRQRR